MQDPEHPLTLEELNVLDIESDVGTEAYLVRKIKEKVEEYYLRAIVFAILYRTGFDIKKVFLNSRPCRFEQPIPYHLFLKLMFVKFLNIIHSPYMFICLI